MKTFKRRALVLSVWIAAGVLSSAALADTPLTTTRVASALNRPVFVTGAPGDTTRLFIVEKRGVIRILNLNTLTLNANPFLDIDSRVVNISSNNDERGLLGLAFHPDYEANGLFYVYYYNLAAATVVAEYSRTTADTADFNSERILLTIAQPQVNHNGGWMGFSPMDGYLYIASGDGGGANDNATGHTPGVGNGQDITNNLLGKILRIDPMGTNGVTGEYGIPASNPFVGVTGDDEIWAFGLRNPWRDAFDSVTGDLWIADVGQDRWEEVNFQPAASAGGENYGWRCREGTQNFNTTGDCSQTPFTDPIHEYAHLSPPNGCSITGGEVYRGCAIPDLRGTYFFADFCVNRIWSMRFNGLAVTDFTERTTELDPPGVLSITGIVSFGRDTQGEVYIVEQGSATAGEVFKIIPNGAVDPPTPQDYDNDGDVDAFDGARFVDCLSAPGTAYSDCLCDVFDDDSDGDVDLKDYQLLQLNFTG